MTFNDILKNKFLDGFLTATPGTVDIAAALLLSGIVGLYIFFIYRIATRKSFYSKSFNISLVAIALIVTGIILAIQSSVVISLGMVGALSIVRFRTAIKDPMDLVFLFWSISIGIISGAGLYEVTVYVSIAVTLAILVLDFIPMVKAPLILVVSCTGVACEDTIKQVIARYTKISHVSSRNLSDGRLDMVVELRIKNESDFIREIASIEGVTNASLVSGGGESIR